MLINLVNNAIKFTESGEVVLAVRPIGDGAKTNIHFSVKDSGIGIPADKLHRLFQSFSQIDSSNTRKFGGTGLGLAISKQLVELMGGKIGIQSDAGKGSTFWFAVPFTFAQSDTGAAPELKSAPSLRGLRVLAVDDTETQREILREQLQAWGFLTEVAPNGTDALAMIRAGTQKAESYQLAIVDMQMPGMDGASLAKAIKSDDALKQTVLLMLTAAEQSWDVAEMEAAGFAACLTKPFRQSELFDAVATALAKRDAAPAIARCNGGRSHHCGAAP